MMLRVKTMIAFCPIHILLMFPVESSPASTGPLLSVREILSDGRFYEPRRVTVRAAYSIGGHGDYIQDLSDFGDSNRSAIDPEEPAELWIKWTRAAKTDEEMRVDPLLTERMRQMRNLSKQVLDFEDVLVIATFDGTVQVKRGFRLFRNRASGEVIGGNGYGYQGVFEGEIRIAAVRDIELITLPLDGWK